MPGWKHILILLPILAAGLWGKQSLAAPEAGPSTLRNLQEAHNSELLARDRYLLFAARARAERQGAAAALFRAAAVGRGNPRRQHGPGDPLPGRRTLVAPGKPRGAEHPGEPAGFGGGRGLRAGDHVSGFSGCRPGRRHRGGYPLPELRGRRGRGPCRPFLGPGRRAGARAGARAHIRRVRGVRSYPRVAGSPSMSVLRERAGRISGSEVRGARRRNSTSEENGR